MTRRETYKIATTDGKNRNQTSIFGDSSYLKQLREECERGLGRHHDSRRGNRVRSAHRRLCGRFRRPRCRRQPEQWRLPGDRGVSKVLAGAPNSHGFNGDNMLAVSAQLNSPSGIAVSGGRSNVRIYIGDSQNNRVRVLFLRIAKELY
jgi:hypothetical protein